MRQTLLAPIAAELSREDGALLLENLPLLEQFGFACEDFGAGALLVREVPADIDAADTVPTLEEFAERLRTGRSPDEKREALLHTMACKAAIKGGWVSDPAELRVLVDRVQSGEIKYCPHGRPVAVKLTKYELENWEKPQGFPQPFFLAEMGVTNFSGGFLYGKKGKTVCADQCGEHRL